MLDKNGNDLSNGSADYFNVVIKKIFELVRDGIKLQILLSEKFHLSYFNFKFLFPYFSQAL